MSAATSTGPTTIRAAGTSITERLVGALTATWAAIQARHADVPDVVLTLGSGTLGARRGEVTWGYFAAGRWHLTTAGEHVVTEPADDVDQDDDGHQDDKHDGGGDGPGAQGLAELFVSGEGLRRGARAVLGTLLHEAAHGVASTRRIKDTSRQGRYHNRRFAELAGELGIVVAPDGARGWSATTLPDATAAVYVAELAGLAEAITAYRSAEATGPGTTTSRNNPPATCRCEPARRIRVARSVLAAGPIVCGCCEAEFTVDEPDDADGDAYGEEVA
jgi:hypothetical protein